MLRYLLPPPPPLLGSGILKPSPVYETVHSINFCPDWEVQIVLRAWAAKDAQNISVEAIKISLDNVLLTVFLNG